MSPLPFGPKKCSKRPTSRIPEKLVLFCQTTSKGPLPLDLLVFGRKQARTLLLISVFGPKKLPRSLLPSLSPFVTVCHCYVTATFLGRKSASDFADDLTLTKNWAGWSKVQISNNSAASNSGPAGQPERAGLPGAGRRGAPVRAHHDQRRGAGPDEPLDAASLTTNQRNPAAW